MVNLFCVSFDALCANPDLTPVILSLMKIAQETPKWVKRKWQKHRQAKNCKFVLYGVLSFVCFMFSGEHVSNGPTLLSSSAHMNQYANSISDLKKDKDYLKS